MTSDSLLPVLEFALAQRHWEMPASLPWMASLLPAIACAGLEFRLSGPNRDVFDLQQCIRNGADVARLRARIDARRRGPGEDDDAGWGLLRDAIDRGAFEQPFEECWLELDNAADGKLPTLSLFVKFDDARDGADLPTRAEKWLGYFGQAPDSGRRRLLERCQAACRPGHKISYLGLMLGRPGAPLRLIVDGLAWSEFTPFLSDAGWHGDAPALQDSLDFLFLHFDRIRLALTIGKVIEPALGFECFLGSQGQPDMRWSSALRELALRRLCTEELRHKIFRWPDTVTPATATAPWPDAMLVEAIARGPSSLSRLDCRISHVKLTFDDGKLASAKGYVGFVEVWQELSASPAAPANADGAAPADVQASLRAALAFLLKSRTPGGWWLDYSGIGNTSDEWVSAYAASAVLDTGDSAAQAAAARAWFLLSRRARAGWGWNHVKPADADSTLWALHLAARLGALASERAESGLAFLHTHIGPGGGLSTYTRSHVEDWSDAAPPPDGWFEVHDCVTAAGAMLDSVTGGALRHLRQAQRPDGSWSSYWWLDAAYPTALAVEALAASPMQCDRVLVARATDWATQRLERALSGSGREGSLGAFALALLARILAQAANPDAALLAGALDVLLRTQQPDGSWEASAWMRMPAAQGPALTVVDRERVITSAIVLKTLTDVQRLPAGHGAPSRSSAA